LKKAEILYEPLPVGRIGFRIDNQEIIAAKDFSCFAQMLEEYISFGAVNIIFPSSSPEIATLEQMPQLLKKRIRIIDDSNEIEIANRLLFEIRKEFNVKIKEESNFLVFPKNTSKELIDCIDQVHSDIKRLALGFNHKIQVNINNQLLIKSLKFLRTKVNNSTSRMVLAQLEAVFNQYKKVEFEALNTPKDDTPYELITIFDKLINDKHYLEYSNAITQLSSPLTRTNARLKIRELTRIIGSKNYIGKGWDYIIKFIQGWTGFPLPESKAIASLIKGNELPSLVNMDNARKRAIKLWRNSNLTNKPLRRNGLPIADNNINWMPPFYMKIRCEDDNIFSLGPARELSEAIGKILKEIDNNKKKVVIHRKKP